MLQTFVNSKTEIVAPISGQVSECCVNGWLKGERERVQRGSRELGSSAIAKLEQYRKQSDSFRQRRQEAIAKDTNLLSMVVCWETAVPN